MAQSHPETLLNFRVDARPALAGEAHVNLNFAAEKSVKFQDCLKSRCIFTMHIAHFLCSFCALHRKSATPWRGLSPAKVKSTCFRCAAL